MAKITAIHGGGDWYDASAEYLILPDGMDFEEELKLRNVWYNEEYVIGYRLGHKPYYTDIVEWLKNKGAVEPSEDQLDVVWDH
jgi:hypothetical protein